MIALAIALHTLAAVVWVGGMFFAHMALRPAVGPMTPKDRLELWSRVFPRFFTWVWLALATLLASGYGMVIVTTGFGAAPMHVHIMQGTGLVMMALFLVLFFGPYKGFRAAMAAGDLPAAAGHQGRIRRIVAINLALGLLTSALGAGGRAF